MYIVTRQNDYESADILSAYLDQDAAIAAAEALVSAHMDAWDVSSSRQDVKHAGNMGPATIAIASWRVYDLCTYEVHQVLIREHG